MTDEINQVPSTRCYFCRQVIEGEGLLIWSDGEGTHLGDLPKLRFYEDTYRLCSNCCDKYRAVDGVLAELGGPSEPPVRIGGYVVHVLDEGHNFDEPEEHSRLQISVYRPGNAYGSWSFGFFPRINKVKVVHDTPTSFTKSGSFYEASEDLTFDMSADQWRSDPVGAAAPFVGREIASEAAPMFVIPLADQIDAANEEERDRLLARLRDQEDGKREWSDDFVLHCWWRGAISWKERQDYERRWERGDFDPEGDDPTRGRKVVVRRRRRPGAAEERRRDHPSGDDANGTA